MIHAWPLWNAQLEPGRRALHCRACGDAGSGRLRAIGGRKSCIARLHRNVGPRNVHISVFCRKAFHFPTKMFYSATMFIWPLAGSWYLSGTYRCKAAVS
jgi:hypothetical protein